VKNEADTMIYNTEKQLQEHGDKIPDSVKDTVRNNIKEVNDAITTDDGDKIREALEKLKTGAMEIGKAIYASSKESPKEEEHKEEQKEGEQKEEKK